LGTRHSADGQEKPSAGQGQLYPNFNIGISTGQSRPGWENRWTAPYRHWSFVPKEFKVDPDRFK